MPVTITASGSDDVVLNQVAADGGYPVTHPGSTRNRIEQVAADAGAGQVPAVSDRNAIEWLAEALNGFVWALSGEFAPMMGFQAATVTEKWSVSASGEGGFIAATDPLSLIPLWSGVRWIEARNPVVNNKVVGVTFGDTSGNAFAVRREDYTGQPGNTHWAFYLEHAGADVAVHRVEISDAAVPAIGIDGDTGECLAVIDGVPVSLPAAFADGWAGFGGVALAASVDWGMGTGSGSIKMVALKESGYTNPLTGFDMQGNPL